jgi:hypothetical protein
MRRRIELELTEARVDTRGGNHHAEHYMAAVPRSRMITRESCH